jgi:hypothetical protein
MLTGGLFALTAKTYAEGASMFPEAGGWSSSRTHRRTCDLGVKDLPVQYQDAVGRRRLSRMEQVERAAIVRALAV